MLGDIVNTDAAFAARKLAELGISVYFQAVVGDNRGRLLEALRGAFGRADLVILTGGLGPTKDDLTKEVTAEYFGLSLERDEDVAAEIDRYLGTSGIPCSEGNSKQALVPAGAHIFPNHNGTAPGLAIRKDGKTAVLLPGPPGEMEPMFAGQVVPFLAGELQETIRSRTLRLFGLGESQVESRLPEDLLSSGNPTLAPYAKRGEVELRITAKGSSAAECEALIEPVVAALLAEFRPYVYGIDAPNLQTVLVEALRRRHLTIATAESLTGGLLSERITEVPGASDIFGLGICSYANAMKEKMLGVSPQTLAAYGAVSPQTAAEMAAGVRAAAGADIGVSTTGIAGPTGGTEAKPVGTVFVAVASSAGTRMLPLNLHRHGAGERDWIRHLTALHALFAVLKLITKGDLLDGQ